MDVRPDSSRLEQTAQATRVGGDDPVAGPGQESDMPVHHVRGARVAQQLADPAVHLFVQRDHLDPPEREGQPGLLGTVAPHLGDDGAGGEPGTGGTQQPMDRLVVPVDGDQGARVENVCHQPLFRKSVRSTSVSRWARSTSSCVISPYSASYDAMYSSHACWRSFSAAASDSQLDTLVPLRSVSALTAAYSSGSSEMVTFRTLTVTNHTAV